MQNIAVVGVFTPLHHYGIGSSCKKKEEMTRILSLIPNSLVRSLTETPDGRSECLLCALAGCHGNGAKEAAVVCV